MDWVILAKVGRETRVLGSAAARPQGPEALQGGARVAGPLCSARRPQVLPEAAGKMVEIGYTCEYKPEVRQVQPNFLDAADGNGLSAHWKSDFDPDLLTTRQGSHRPEICTRQESESFLLRPQSSRSRCGVMSTLRYPILAPPHRVGKRRWGLRSDV